ncbi:hypothetical protein HJG60_011605 [Phyllostomus discolor]|uniref:Uncharacterized protein n=1 Tax=Phyllostomus discolor TaxID=89673 RepID=A0A834DXI1_9CHIR|nr:hypothetical protein HJG60_011605 [Phyllostomus discolor]
MPSETSSGSLFYVFYKALRMRGSRSVFVKHLRTFFLNIRKQKNNNNKKTTIKICLSNPQVLPLPRWPWSPSEHWSRGDLVPLRLRSGLRWWGQMSLPLPELAASATASRQTPVPLTVAGVVPVSCWCFQKETHSKYLLFPLGS